MTGWLIVNHFLNTPKFTLLYDWLLRAAEEKGVSLSLLTNAQVLCLIHQGTLLDPARKKPDFVLFWDKDLILAKALEGMGLLLYNSAEAIAVCDNKALTHIRLSKGRFPMPKTIAGPLVYDSRGYQELSFLAQVEEALSYPFVIKENQGSFGAQVYLANNRREAEEILAKTGSRGVIFQEFVQTSPGRDIRLQVVGNRVVAAMLRQNKTGDFRANITNGGEMLPYDPTGEETRLALSVCRSLKLDFAGVDLLFGQDGPLVCEVNSNAHFVNIYECTGVNAAEEILAYIVKKGGER